MMSFSDIDRMNVDDLSNTNAFLCSDQAEYSYDDLKKFTNYLAMLIGADSIYRKNPILFLSHSTNELVLSIAACWILNIPMIPLHPEISISDLQTIISKLKPAKIFCNSKNYERLSETNKVLLNDEFLKHAIFTDTISEDLKINEDTSNSDTFGYFLTSGTTGNSKIVPLKRRQMISAASSSAKTFKTDQNHFWLLCLPLNHIGGISIILRSLLYRSAIYRMDSFDEQEVAEFLGSDSRFQAVSLVPTMMHRLLKNPEFKTHNTFKAILLGGGPSNSELINKTIDRKIPIILSYGMTETCAQIITNPILNFPILKPDVSSVGILFSPNKLEIRNGKGVSVDENESGSVWLKGPQVFDGYHKIELNKTVFDENDWFNTGDFGHINEFGNLVIESRREDIIITGGENVVPFEIEKALESFPPINEAIVIGIPDEQWGQKVVAIITTKNTKKPTLEEIQNFLKGRLLDFKIPKKLITVDEFPKTALGKIKRKEVLAKVKL